MGEVEPQATDGVMDVADQLPLLNVNRHSSPAKCDTVVVRVTLSSVIALVEGRLAPNPDVAPSNETLFVVKVPPAAGPIVAAEA
jgi:hypothetical protein